MKRIKKTEDSSDSTKSSKQPKADPCAGFCEKCRPETPKKPESQVRRESLIRFLRGLNQRYNTLASEYLGKCSKQFYCSEGGLEKLNKIKAEIENHCKDTENEIQKILKDEHLYEKWYYPNTIERKATTEKWKKIIFKIDSQVNDVADHVETWYNQIVL